MNDVTADVASTFSDGAAYERRVGRWSRPVGTVFAEWLGVPPNSRWLDIGCGGGAFSQVVIDRCAPAAVAGLDPSEAQLAYARGRLGPKAESLERGDAQNLPFPADSFDAAVMALVIQFVPDPLKAAAEMARVVRAGGTIGAYVWDYQTRGAPFHPMHDALKDIGILSEIPYREISSAESLRAVWQKAGLHTIETRAIQVTAVFADFEDYWESNASDDGPRGKIIRDLPPAMRERLRRRLQEILPIGADGSIAYEAAANAVKGRVPN